MREQTSVLGTAAAEIDFLKLARPGLAWEFLRRNPDYALACVRSGDTKKRLVGGASTMSVIEAPDCAVEQRNWGLCYVEHPKLAYAGASVFWQSSIDPGVLPVTAHRGHGDGKSDNEPIDFSRLDAEVTVLKLGTGLEHVRITHGPYAIQLEVLDGSVLHGPVRLTYHINGFGTLKPKVLTLQRLSAFQALGRFPASLFAPDARVKRLFMALRALDMAQAGLSHREIAVQLFGDEIWRNRSDWVRSRVRRVLATARRISEGGYLDILGGTSMRAVPDASSAASSREEAQPRREE